MSGLADSKLAQRWLLNNQFILLVIVFIANIRIYWVQVLVKDDYYYGLYRWKELGAPPQISQEGFFLINRWLCWLAGNVNVYLARSLVLFCIVLPSALLIYAILKKLKYPEPAALFTAAMVWISPGQTEIPYFVNGSYTAESMLFMLLSFWSGLKFIENEGGYLSRWFAFAALFYFWSLNISELIVPCTLAIIFCYLFWSKFSRKAMILSLIMAVTAVYHTYFKIINNGRDVVSVSRPLSFRGLGNVLLSFVDWCMPATGISYVDDHIWHKWILFTIIVLVIFTIAVRRTVRWYIGKGVRSWKHIFEEDMFWQIIFPLLLFIAPLIIMTISPWFNVRHVIFSAMGFYILFSFAANIFIADNRSAVFFFAIVMLVTIAKHDVNVDAEYSKMNKDNSQFLHFIGNKKIPQNSQIVVVNMDVSTCGYGYWSTGYLEYVTKRKDVTGLIGKEINMINPFKKHEYSEGGMNGLSINLPLFLYRKNNGDFEQLTHFLQWKQNTMNSDFAIYSVDPYTGGIALAHEGKGMDAFVATSRMLSVLGIKRSDILWGGELPPHDLR